MEKTACVIGSGFAGLSAACYLAKEGYAVTVLEKNATFGGRARQFRASGFSFDMGPSWYWMPDVFDRFFENFGYKVSDFYKLVRLDPSYTVHVDEKKEMIIPAKMEKLMALFESYEKGAAKKLKLFLEDAQYKYEVGINEFVQKPAHGFLEFVDFKVAKSVFKLNLFTSISNHIRQYFKNPHLIKLLEFPVLFLGAMPSDIPALYSLMNYADMSLGTWYPMGGMTKIIEGMIEVAKKLGVKFVSHAEVFDANVDRGKIESLRTSKGDFEADIYINTADYQYFDQNILPKEYRQYDKKYWNNRVLAPSSLLFYLGFDCKIDKLKHHNLFFDGDFDTHASQIYETPKWPSDPLFYVCCPSKTDVSVAPEGCENVFLLMPIAPDIKDNDELREEYFDVMIDRLEKKTGQKLKGNIIYKRSFAVNDFKSEYYSFKGNAYGLANTLKQTGPLKPKMKSTKLSNLYHAGQLTTPGPGVPPSIISGEVAAREICKNYFEPQIL